MTALTAPQRKQLGRADSRGIIECPYLTRGIMRNNWERMMRRMVPEYVTPYVHGGYELTAAGRVEAGLPADAGAGKETDRG